MYRCTAAFCSADFSQSTFCFTAFITLVVLFTIQFYGNFKPFGKCIYYRCTYTVQTAGYLVSSTAEFTARMQDGKYNFYGRDSLFLINLNRNTTAVINNSNGIVFIDGDIDYRTVSCKCFIHCIINYLIYKMMKSACRSTSDVHTGTFPYCFQSFQYLNLICAVFLAHVFLISVAAATFPTYNLRFVTNFLLQLSRFLHKTVYSHPSAGQRIPPDRYRSGLSAFLRYCQVIAFAFSGQAQTIHHPTK